MIHKTLSGVTEDEFDLFCDFLTVKTGLALRSEKKGELLELLSERMAAVSPPQSFEEYFRDLQGDGDSGAELRSLLVRLTVGETHFFRNRPQFDALRSLILPELIKKKRAGRKSIRIWSAGCSTGEEPYSIAMLLQELLPDMDDWSVTILATDINRESLVTAKEGYYRDWSFREADEYYQRRYFVEAEKGWRISSRVSEMVTFRYLNLAEDVYPSGVTGTDEQDLILCRNVMIYFNIDLSLEITGRFFRCLNEGGCLLVGHAEHNEMVSPRFRRQMLASAILYRKSARGEGDCWEKGIKLRFRGSGKIGPDQVVHQREERSKRSGVQRPADTKETVQFEKAVSLYKEMLFDEALAIFRDILALNPSNERARYMAALIAANCGDIDEAEKDVLLLLDDNPLHLEATYLRSLVCRVRGDREAEFAALKKTLYVNQEFVLGHFQMGVFYLREDKTDDARRAFLNVLKILKERPEEDFVAGIDGLTVGRLRRTVCEMIPGGAPEEFHRE